MLTCLEIVNILYYKLSPLINRTAPDPSAPTHCSTLHCTHLLFYATNLTMQPLGAKVGTNSRHAA